MTGIGAHAQPFYCPYCGEEDFEPYGEEPGRFACNSCDRHFTVRFLGLGAARSPHPGDSPGGRS